MSNKVLLVGGRLKPQSLIKETEQYYDLALVLRLDIDTGRVKRLIDYNPVENLGVVEGNNITFKAASISSGLLHLVTEIEVLKYSLANYSQVDILSLKAFNDCHHVLEDTAGHRWVAVSGLDAVLEIGLDNEIKSVHPALPKPQWRGMDSAVDYRKLQSLKPHAVHPNHLFRIGEELFVTRFQQRDAISLSNASRCINIGVGSPHDGVVQDGRIYFTTVNGHVVVADSSSLSVVGSYDLNKISGEDRPLGWCRGIHAFDEDNVLVGFSRLRPTKIRQNLKWVGRQLTANKFKEALPTRVVHYDLKRGSIVRSYDLEEAGLGAVFSVLLEP